MYIGNDLQIAHPSYKIIDDISSGFNGSTTSFALQVSGATPVPFPISTQQVMISVNGVVQEPDPNGSAGFKLLGSNIVFSSAPANGHAFFGVINAGADYVTAGSEFPDGSVTAPSFTFQDDQDTGWYRIGSGSVGYSANGTQILDFDGNGLNIPDNKKIQFGGGNDLQISHDGSNSYINNSTGALYLRTGTGLNLQNAAGTETYLYTEENGAVFLRYDNVNKLETTSTGTNVTGVHVDDGATHDGDVSFNGASYNSWWDKSDSAFKFDDNAKIKVGTGGDLQIYHNGSKSYITDAGTGGLNLNTNLLQVTNAADNEVMIKATEDGAVELYYDNSKKFETTSGGVKISGYLDTNDNNIVFGDSADADTNRITMGAASGGDLKIYHDGTDAFFSSQTGNIDFRTTNAGSINLRADDKYGIYIQNSGTVRLYYDNAAKIETTATGISVTGAVSDSKGDVRKIVQNYQTGAYVLVVGDAGKCITITTGGVTVNPSIFAAGDAVSIINHSGSNQTITQGSSFTLYNTADGATGNRTLAGRGMCTLFFTDNNIAYVSGAGLS